jgi:malonyl-CoA O-methyltransferase
MAPILDKRRMRAAFSRQAAVYERYSHLQRRIGDRLLEALNEHGEIRPDSILDIGCGTGYLMGLLKETYPSTKTAGMDISPGMLHQCRRDRPDCRSLVLADAEALPIGAERFGLVVSTSTYQWVEPLDRAFGEAARICRPGGLFAAAVFSLGTLDELRDCYGRAWSQKYPGRPADLHPFPDRTAIHHGLTGAGFRIREAFGERYALDFPDLEGIFRYLKGLGAQNAVRSGPGGPGGLGRRGLLARTGELYRAEYGDNNGLPASFAVEFFIAEKGLDPR